jgi:hypothetical protein
MPPEPRTVPTYDLDGIAIRIPVLSIPDQGPVYLSLTLDELVEVLSKCLDICHSGRIRKRFKLTLTEVGITTHPIALPMPLLK